MTPQEAFQSKGFNPKMGLWANDWYAAGSTFVEANIIHEGNIITGMRVLTVLDVASHYHMHFKMIESAPDAARADDVICLLNETFTKYQRPQVGVVISNSVWYSSLELLNDEDTTDRGEFLRDIGAEFGPMSWDGKKKLSDWATAQGLRCEFNGDNI